MGAIISIVGWSVPGPGIIHLGVNTTNFHTAYGCQAPLPGASGPIFFNADLSATPQDAPATSATAICYNCLGQLDFKAQAPICTTTVGGVEYSLLMNEVAFGSDSLISALAAAGTTAPAQAFVNCMATLSVQVTAQSQLGGYTIQTFMQNGRVTSDGATTATVTVDPVDCNGAVLQFLPNPGAGFVVGDIAVNLTVPCPVDLRSLVPLEVPLGWSTDLPPDVSLFEADLFVERPGEDSDYPYGTGFPLLKVLNTQTPNATWTVVDESTGLALCRADNYTIAGRFAPDGAAAELFGYAPSVAYFHCINSIVAVLDPSVPHFPVNVTQPYTVFLVVQSGFPYPDPANAQASNTSTIGVLLTPCVPSSPLIPSLAGAPVSVPFGFGCLRQGVVPLSSLVTIQSPSSGYAISRLSFTCAACATNSVYSQLLPYVAFTGGSFSSPNGSFGFCTFTPAGSVGRILVTTETTNGGGGWAVKLSYEPGFPFALPEPSLAQFVACASAVGVHYGGPTPSQARTVSFAISAKVGALINPYVLNTTAPFTLSNTTCAACLTTLYPYELPNLEDSLRTFTFAVAPPISGRRELAENNIAADGFANARELWSGSTAQAPVPFIPVVPLEFINSTLNPPCPVCGFRIEILVQARVFGQDLLTCPSGLPSYVFCSYYSNSRVLVLTIPPDRWSANITPTVLAWALTHVAFVNTAGLHVQGLRSFSLSFQQCGIEGEVAWYPPQYFPSVDLETQDIVGAPVCPLLRTDGSVYEVDASNGPVPVEPLVLLEGLLAYEPLGVVGANVIVQNCIPGEDILDIDPSTLAALPGLHWSWVPDICKLRLEGGRPFVDYALLLRNIRYKNAKGSFATPGPRYIQMYVWTPRCASRFWYSTLIVHPDCNNRCLCSPRFGLTFTSSPPIPVTKDPYVEVYYRSTGIAVCISEIQAPLGASSNGQNNQWLYCDHPSRYGSSIASAEVCITHDYEPATDVIIYTGPTQASYFGPNGTIHSPHPANASIPLVYSPKGFENRWGIGGCIRFLPLPPTDCAPSWAFINAINTLIFALGGPGSSGADRTISVNFTSPVKSSGGGVCIMPPVKVLLQVPADQLARRTFQFCGPAIDPSPLPTPSPSHTPSATGTPTRTPSATGSHSPTGTGSASATNTATGTATPSNTGTASESPSTTGTASHSSSATQSASPTLND